MKTREHRIEVDGRSLAQFEWLPDGPARGAAMLVHGQGECASRHATTIRPLVGRGIACSGVDFPGHGDSPGPRGHIAGMQAVGRILATARRRFEERGGLPVDGWVAHSMGGLVTLHHLADPATPAPRFLWLSSPLADPAAGRSRLARRIALTLGGVFPLLPMHTGVRLADCRVDDDHHDPVQDVIAECGHDRISLGWAAELVRLGESLPATVARLDPSIRLLFTQGLADPVCPPDLGRRLFEMLPLEHKRWAEFPAARHEPFADANVAALHRAVGSWLDEEVLPPA